MHEDVCPYCDHDGSDCWRCGGSGIVLPDDPPEPYIPRLTDPVRRYAECPRCGNLMATASTDEVWCKRCDRGFRPVDGDAVADDPSILEG